MRKCDKIKPSPLMHCGHTSGFLKTPVGWQVTISTGSLRNTFSKYWSGSAHPKWMSPKIGTEEV